MAPDKDSVPLAPVFVRPITPVPVFSILPANVVDVPLPPAVRVAVVAAALLVTMPVLAPAKEPIVFEKLLRSSVPDTVKAELGEKPPPEPAFAVPPVTLVAPL